MISTITFKPYQDPETDAAFEQDKSRLLSEAEHYGTADGLQNRPLDAQSFALYKASVYGSVQSMLTDFASRYQSISGIRGAKELKEQTAATVRSERAVVTEQQAKYMALKSDLERAKPNAACNRAARWATIATLLGAGCEALLNQKSFLALGLTMVYTACASLGLMAIVYAGIGLLARYLRKAKSRRDNIIRLGLTLLIFFVFFAFLAILRVHAATVNASLILATDDATPAPTTDYITASAIAGISFALAVVALFISKRYQKTTAQLKIEEDYKDATKEAEKLATEIARRSREIDELERASAVEQNLMIQKFEYVLALQDRCRNLGLEAILRYVQVNCRCRPDGLTPAFFSVIDDHEYTSVFRQIPR